MKQLFLAIAIMSWGCWVAADTLTVYPDPNPETTSVDGYTQRKNVDEPFLTILHGSGSNSGDSDTGATLALISSSVTSNQFDDLRRSIFLFDTSALTGSANVTSATFSVNGTLKVDNMSITPDLNVYSSSPSSNTAVAPGDYLYTSFGSTAFSTAISYASFSTSGYNDFALNASGLAAISLTNITKLGLRNANYDVAESQPTWSSNVDSYLFGNFADNAGTSADPKLVIIYTIPPPAPSNAVIINGNTIINGDTIIY